MASLSSILNPSSEKDEGKTDSGQSAQSTSSTSPVATHLPSPEFLHSQLPKYTPPQRVRRPSSSVGGQSLNGLQRDTKSNVTVTNTNDAQTRLSESLHAAEGGETSRLPDGGMLALTQHEDVGQSISQDAVMAEDGQSDGIDDGKVVVKQEMEDSEVPSESRLSTHMNGDQSSSNRHVNTLKQEHASRTQSPLRESSTALSTTEDPHSSSANMKKRPGLTKKKGTATTAKKPRSQLKKKTSKAKPKSGIRSFSPANSDSRSFSADVDEDDDVSEADSDDDVEGSGDVYCICRKPDNGTFMIGCDGNCDDWFHGKCVGIEERDKHLMDKYICPSCTARDVGRTSWKRMCRRLGCRLPARVGRNAHKDGSTSKYCSDECGVLFFREMSARSRGKDGTRKPRRKTEDQHNAGEENGNARGGLLSTGEVKAMLDLSNTAVDFKNFGNGVLSPPPTPQEFSGQTEVGLTEAEAAALRVIESNKEQARQRHACLKDRLAFIDFVKAEATRLAVAQGLKPKEYCGFDPRITWSDTEFSAWRQSDIGQQAFQQASLEQLSNGVSDQAECTDEDMAVCSRKKCARHVDWSKLAVDEIRFEMTDNSDHMRSLEQEAEEVKQQAGMRNKDIVGEGTVEWHESTEGQDAMMDIDQRAYTPLPINPVAVEV